MMNDKKLFLLDAYALIFRAYYAFISNPIKNSKGFNTSTIFGFVNTLDEVLRKEAPSHIAVVFDPEGPTFRKEIFPQYKANREDTPEDIKKSIPLIKKIIKAYNIPVIESPGFEADDVIGTLSKQAEKQGFKVYLMTPDKDYAQLVSENIFMYKPKRSGGDVEIWGINEVKEKFEIDSPLQVIDVLALWGDSSDNVPGVPGIGEKTSKKLISEYKSLDGVYENIKDLKGKQKENLWENQEQARLCKTLVTIRLDAPVSFDSEEYLKGDFNRQALLEIFEDLEFKTLITRILGENGGVSSPSGAPLQGDLFSGSIVPHSETRSGMNTMETSNKKYHLLDSVTLARNLQREILKKGAFCFDTETTALDPIIANLVGIAISCNKDVAYFYPHSIHPDSEILSILKELIEDKNLLKVGQNLKFDIRVLMSNGIYTQGPLFDTMVAHYLINPEQRHNLNFLAEKYLNYTPVSIESLIGAKGRNQGSMASVPLGELKDYACEDADITWQLYEILSGEIENSKLSKLANEVEMPLVSVLARMEQNGIRIDKDNLEGYAKVLNEDLIVVEKRIYELAGQLFNISSPKQLGEILFEKLQITKDARKTKTRQYSTSEDVLLGLSDRHEIVPAVLEFRSLKKLLSTYVEALPKLINQKTGRVHTSFNQTLVATGRLSSNNPNLQNIPIREERGREIRKSFVPGTNDNIIIAADYSQIELRLMAHLSGDENMIAAFKNNEDIHTTTASRIYGITEKEVTREMRSQAKTANFGIIYGISAFGLSQRLGIKRTEAKELIDGYFRSFPGVRDYMDDSIRRAREEDCVYTIMGRKRYLPDIHSRNSVVRGVAERNAINAPIQGSAADIIKIAMVKIHERMKAEGLNSRMILQVHDELVFDVIAAEEDVMKKLIREEMENAWKLAVPLTVDLGKGKNWLEAH